MKKEKLNNIESGGNMFLTWIQKISELRAKYGFWTLFQNILLVIIVCSILIGAYNFKNIIEFIYTHSAEVHLTAIEERSKKDLLVKQTLSELLAYNIKAQRTWIFQYHNGTHDWSRGTIRFENAQDGVTRIAYQYDNIPLTLLGLSDYLELNNSFSGNLSELQHIDGYIYEKFLENGTEYIICITLKNSEGKTLGILGCTWNWDLSKLDKFNLTQIENSISKYASMIQTNLE